MFRLFECCALSFFERFVLSFSLKIERFVSDSAEIWICGLYFVMADDTMKVKNDTVAVEDGFKNIDLKEVPQSVKDAIAKKYPESTLKSASLSLKEEGVKAYRIIYVTKEGVENSILINIKTAPAKTAPATK